MKEDSINRINKLIKQSFIDTNQISDGFHTFDELYAHRNVLFIALCRLVENDQVHGKTWRSCNHNDGTNQEGWFILGLEIRRPGQHIKSIRVNPDEQFDQVTYHLPLKYWDDCNFAEHLPNAPKWDGHTSADVIQRLKDL